MEPIRILHMIGSLEVGGSQAMVINLYKAIDREKIQFDFIVDHPDLMELAETVKALGARIYTMPTFVGSNLVSVRRAWHRFFREHPEYKVLHSHVRSYASVYLPIAKKHGLKTIIHSHSTSNGSGVTALVKLALQFPLRYQADYFFSCSQEAGQWLFGKKVTGSHRHFILKNAINASQYRFDPDIRAQYRQQLQLDGHCVYVHVGRFHPAKNHLFLLDVFAELHRRQPDSLLLLVGDGELRDQISQKIQELDLTQSIRLLGNRMDVSCILQAADCFLFPSAWEGLGIVAVEAQAAGLPCLCSDQVPRAVQVIDSCRFLPLDSVQNWADSAMALPQERSDTSGQIIAHGYDIHSTASWLMHFYLKAVE